MAASSDSQISLRETKTFRQGRVGEEIISYYLQKSGCWIIPSYAFTDDEGEEKAPRLQKFMAGYIIPDLDVSKEGTRFWVEAKTKCAPTFTRIMQQFEHGIPLRHYQHYLRVQRITGCKVYLFIYEETSREILYIKLDDIHTNHRIYSGNKMSYGGMIFFPKDTLQLWKQVPQEIVDFITKQLFQKTRR